MDSQSFLIFELNQSLFGVNALAVQEMFAAPEITPLADLPTAILGVINLRGDMIPVMNLHHALRLKAGPPQLSDGLIIIKGQPSTIGILVNQIHNVLTLPTAQISMLFQPEGNSPHLLNAGIAQCDHQVISLLHPDALCQLAHGAIAPLLDDDIDSVAESYTERYIHLSAEAQRTLKDRAAHLRRSLIEREASDRIPLAVVKIDQEYFGLAVEIVNEFTTIQTITPIPCCPDHILGNINLRGEIITLIDIAASIHLPAANLSQRKKAIIVRIEDRVAGVTVDDIFDVVYVHPTQILSAPVAVHASDDYFQGVVPYRDRMMSIINLPKLFKSDALVVDEVV